MLLGVCYIPLRWKFEIGVAMLRFALIDHLNWQKITYQRSTKYCCDEALVVGSADLYSFGTLPVHGPVVAGDDLDAGLIPVKLP